MAFAQALLQEMLSVLAAAANDADANPAWPEVSWQALCQAGVPAWSIPTAYGGQGRSGPELLEGYERLASSCLTTCFILSQHDAACRRIRDSGHESLCQELLPPLARGERFATVGLSQLTTSRQHGKPAMTARPGADGFILDGTMPWVTGAERADHLITGAVMEDGRQILAAVPRKHKNVLVAAPLPLMALQGSLTTEVRCENVALDPRWILAGPVEKVMVSGRGGTGGLETSCLALGLAGAAIDFLHQEAKDRPDLLAGADHLEQRRRHLRQDLHQAMQQEGTPAAATAMRARANTLVLGATQAALTASKGTGFLRHHPAQRWARQALFFLVWSCPRPAAEATVAHLIGSPDQECL